MATNEEWLASLDMVRNNPTLVQRLALDQYRSFLAGDYDIVDPTNPFVFLIEASSMNATAAMVRNETNLRRQYPSMAVTDQEIYLHMSDRDYLDRFAEPSYTTISLILGYDEVQQRAVAYGSGGNRRLMIPRNSEFTVADHVFTMLNPIEIRVMSHGGLQIVYNTDSPSPLEPLESNQLNWTAFRVQGESQDFLKIDIPIKQLRIATNYGKLNLATGFTQVYNFTDQFHYARVYYARADGSWKEMRTTHTDQVYDPLTPTAVLKLLTNKLQVTIPQVYLTTELINSDLRIDIYTTEGPLELNLSDYPATRFSARWLDLDGDQYSAYFAPLSVFTTYSIFSSDTVTGGRNALTFAELRLRMLDNALGDFKQPISEAQLSVSLQDLGYTVVKDVDNVTDRTYLATRSVPVPTGSDAISGIGCAIRSLLASMDTLAGYSTVADNGTRITVLPETLYLETSGVLEVVDQAVIDAINALDTENKTRLVSSRKYLYSPFHYVLDRSSDVFDLRAYYLGRPTINFKNFVDENPTTGISVSIGDYDVTRTASGYHLTIACRSSDAWKDLSDPSALIQVSFIPKGEVDRAYLNMTLTGVNASGERIYECDLTTNYDIDSSDSLTLTNFQMYENPADTHSTSLTQTFEFTFIAGNLNLPSFQASYLDSQMGIHILPAGSKAISRETISIELGRAVQALWTESRSIPSEEDYQRYQADVPATWPTTVYATDPQTGTIKITYDPQTQQVGYTILHRAGDPMTDAFGNALYAHRKGEVVTDGDGDVVVVNSRKLNHQLDLFLMDGTYWFANDPTVIKYRDDTAWSIVEWVTEDIPSFTQALLEQTRLLFYPQSTLGPVNALVVDNKNQVISSEQSLSVVFYLTGEAFRDVALKTALEATARSVISKAFASAQVTISGIVTEILAKVGSDAITVTVSGLGGDAELAALTLVDETARLSVKKKLSALSNGQLTVIEDIQVAFLNHDGT